MADSYLTAVLQTDLTSSRYLTATPGCGILLQDNGPQQPMNIVTNGLLGSLGVQGSRTGYVISLGSNTALIQGFASSSTITAVNPLGTGGQTSFNMITASSTQNIQVQIGGDSARTPRPLLNFIAGSGIGLSAVDNGSNGSTDITITSSGGGSPAPVNATYWTSSANGTLTNEVNLGLLAPGIVQIAVSGSVATPSTLGVTAGNIPLANGTAWTALPIGADGEVLTSNGTTASWVASSGAPDTSQYLIATVDEGLPDAINIATLSGVSTGAGIIASTVTAGVAALTYFSSTAGNLLIGNGTGFTALGIGGNGTVLTSNGTTATWVPSSGGAPNSATYWTSSANGTLTNEVNLGGLTTGLLLNTVTTGVATPSVLSPSAGNIPLGNGTTYTTLGIGSSGNVLTSNGTTAAWAAPTPLAARWFVGTILPGANSLVTPTTVGNMFTITGYTNVINLLSTALPRLGSNSELLVRISGTLDLSAGSIAAGDTVSFGFGTNLFPSPVRLATYTFQQAFTGTDLPVPFAVTVPVSLTAYISAGTNDARLYLFNDTTAATFALVTTGTISTSLPSYVEVYEVASYI